MNCDTSEFNRRHICINHNAQKQCKWTKINIKGQNQNASISCKRSTGSKCASLLTQNSPSSFHRLGGLFLTNVVLGLQAWKFHALWKRHFKLRCTYVRFLREQEREEPEVVGKAMHTPCSVCTGLRRDMKMGIYLFLDMWFCQRILVPFLFLGETFLCGAGWGLKTSFQMFVLTSEYWSFLTQQYSCITTGVCPRERPTPEIGNLDGRPRRDSTVTSWRSAGVQIKESGRSICERKVLQLESFLNFTRSLRIAARTRQKPCF